MHDEVFFSRRSNVGSRGTNMAGDVDSAIRRSGWIRNAHTGRRPASDVLRATLEQVFHQVRIRQETP